MAEYRYRCDDCDFVTNAYGNDSAAKAALELHRQHCLKRKQQNGY
jgi:hypothetical protein